MGGGVRVQKGGTAIEVDQAACEAQAQVLLKCGMSTCGSCEDAPTRNESGAQCTGHKNHVLQHITQNRRRPSSTKSSKVRSEQRLGDQSMLGALWRSRRHHTDPKPN